MTRSLVLPVALGCALAASALRAEEPETFTADCSWSASWKADQPHADRTTAGAVAPTHKPIKLEARPRPEPGERFSLEGPSVVVILVDTKGTVADARITRSAAKPPWPRYEASLLKAIRKLQFKPGTLDGKPVAFCDILAIQDKPTPP